MDARVKPAHDELGSRRTFAFSRRDAPEVCQKFPYPLKTEGAGNAGCALHPRSRAQCAQEVRARAYRAAENIRHPLRNGFTAYFELSPENGSFASVAPRKLLPPGALTPAPRRRDHTTSPYALMPFAIGTASVHRDPPHDHGDHDTPLWSGRDGCDVAVIWILANRNIFDLG